MEYLLDITDIVIRSLVSLVFMFVITRMMGKKQISQLTFFDYVIGISFGSLAATLAATDEIPYRHVITGMIVYGVVALFISVITNKSIMARRFFTGKTFLLIDQGKILEENLKRVRYDVNDLLAEARCAGYFNIADVEYALMETSGRISFVPVANKQIPTLSDLKIEAPQEHLTANVVIDGEVMHSNLKAIELDEIWLEKALKQQRIDRIQDVILATVDSQKNLSVYLKTRKVVNATPID